MAVSCGVGDRHGSDLALMWLCQRLAATGPIQPLAWKSPYATVANLKRPKTKKKKKKRYAYVYLLCVYSRKYAETEILNIA